ncbi:hypothetical protein Tco_0995062 [Tanacetum coccineum]
MQADRLLHDEVEERVDGLVEEVEGLENQRAELVDELQLQDLLPTIIAQVGNHVNNPGNNGDQNGNGVDDNI